MDEDFESDFEALEGRPLREPQNYEEAKQILRYLRMRNGFHDSQDEAELDRASNRGMREKIMAKNTRKILAQYTKLISSQLYSDVYHFLHEVIQNADDAEYRMAKGENKEPSMTFHFDETELIIDLNEDGFSLNNIVAICSTGQSSKKTSDNTTGEKGLGFKSVFGIASEVHIQSGLWSFTFRHQRHEDGIGMISPSWQEPTRLPSGVRTRFKLKYSFPRGITFEKLCARVKKEPVTSLIFLRQIRKIIFNFSDNNGYYETVTFKNCPSPAAGRLVLSATIDGREKMHYFHRWQGNVDDMPEREGRFGDKSTVTICFPVRDHIKNQPLIDTTGQFVFAYLPIHKIPDLPFIMQADFQLPVSRQDIVDQEWNQRLREGIAKLFVDCAHEFSKHEGHPFRHTWLKYFPRKHLIGFWESLPDLIRDNLKHVPTLLDTDGSLHTASDVRLVPDIFMYNGSPLINNTSKKYSYMSLEYDRRDLAVFNELGVATLTSEEMRDAVKADADPLSPSQLHQTPLSDAWHNKHAALVKSLISGPGLAKNAAEVFKNASMFPLVSKGEAHWGALHQRTVYFPGIVKAKIGDVDFQIDMPPDLSFTIINPAAVKDTIRKELYQLLGVIQCPGAVICKDIRLLHQKSTSRAQASFLTHLEILFWFGDSYESVLKAGSVGGQLKPTNEMFFQSSKEFDAECAVGLRGVYKHHLLEADYQQSQVQSFVRDETTWIKWLEDSAKVQWYPPLQKSVKEAGLHWTFEAVLRESPEKFVPLLQAHWAENYADVCRSNKKITETILDAQVPCVGGGMRKLRHVFFPTQDVLEQAQRYGVVDAIGILALPGAMQGASLNDWPSLRDLSVQHSTKLEFLKRILVAISATSTNLVNANLMAALYQRIGSTTSSADREDLKAFFADNALFWDPKRGSWLMLEHCVWSSKVPLNRKSVIMSCYPTASVQELFREQFKIGDSTINDYIGQLEEVREMQTTESHQRQAVASLAIQLYGILDALANNDNAKKDIRSAFKKQDLIYFKGQWIKPKSCVWHESSTAGGHHPIKSLYQGLQTFFVVLLGVEMLDDAFMMRQLVDAASRPDKNLAEIIKLMLETSVLLEAECNNEVRQSINKLKEARFLPCRTSREDLVFLGPSDEFLIPDDLRFASAFDGKVCLLDVTYADLNILHGLLAALNLQDKYLSKNVQARMERGDCTLDEKLTNWFRECAFAISSCAVFFQSPFYANQVSDMHDRLRNAAVYISPNMSSAMVVKQGNTEHRVQTSQMSLIMTVEPEKLSIVLPKSQREQRLCKRSRLPAALMEELELFDISAMKSISRMLDEVDTGTDQILAEEGIPQAEWLEKTQRVPLPTPPPTPELPSAPLPSQVVVAATGETVAIDTALPNVIYDEIIVSTAEGTEVYQLPIRQTQVAVPEVVDHYIEAPAYHRILEHVIQQLLPVESNSDPRPFKSPGLQKLFGSDDQSVYRIGAAGELFVFELLKSLTDGQASLENWPSSLRHYTRALQDHQVYGSITQWSGAETSDLLYNDIDCTLLRTLKLFKSVDDGERWMPEWLQNTDRPLEWHFEVKTTVGTCDRPFTMSRHQYNRMRRFSEAAPRGNSQIFCLVRVYDLTKDEIGVRFYIDPWREGSDPMLEFDTTDKWVVTTK